jgi:hypothetical protein
VEQVILRAMSTDPANRYQTAGEMARALQLAVELTGDSLSLTRRIEAISPEATEQSPRREAILTRPDANPAALDKSLQKPPRQEIKIPSLPRENIVEDQNQPKKSGSITISANSGQVIIGGHNIQSGPMSGGQVFVGGSPIQVQAQMEDQPARLVRLSQMLADLGAKIVAEAPPDKKDPALERLSELAETLTASTPDLDTIAYVKGWFAKNIPALAQPVANLISHPLTVQFIAAAGQPLAADFYRRFLAKPG